MAGSLPRVVHLHVDLSCALPIRDVQAPVRIHVEEHTAADVHLFMEYDPLRPTVVLSIATYRHGDVVTLSLSRAYQ